MSGEPWGLGFRVSRAFFVQEVLDQSRLAHLLNELPPRRAHGELAATIF